MPIKAVPALSDNYIWVYHRNSQAFIVDPGESEGVLNYLEENHLILNAILLTHKHGDHTDGVMSILEKFPETPVYGPSETASWATHIVKEGDSFELLGQQLEVFKTAGHTEEHVSFIMGKALFCGDALFSGGCGRVFTGDYAAQFDALQKFSQLDNDVQIYAGHEYTQTNLEFAQSIFPDNENILRALKQTKETLSQGEPTLPTTVGNEREINVFLQADNLEGFIKLRNARDIF